MIVNTDHHHANDDTATAASGMTAIQSLLQSTSSSAMLRGPTDDGSRHLTFLDEDDEDYYYDVSHHSTKFYNGMTIGFTVLAVAFCITAVVSMRLTTRVREFYEWNAVRLIFPWISCVLAMECATLAYDIRHVSVGTTWAIIMYMLQATVAPGVFLSTFVVTYLAHRTRSIPFCVVYRGPGRSILNLGGIPVAATTTTMRTTTGTSDSPPSAAGCSDSPTGVGRGGGGGGGGDIVMPQPQRHRHDLDDDEDLQGLVRPATMVVMIRLFALGLLILSLMVNFNIVWDESALAGRTGWVTIFTSLANKRVENQEEETFDGTYSEQDDDAEQYIASWSLQTIHIFLSLLPMAVVSSFCMYFSLLLWRYGTVFSMIIYGSLLNPWLSPVVGTLCLIGGQVFGPTWFPLMSNLGILLYIISVLLLLLEVHKDVRCSNDLGQFLDALGDDQVAGSVAPPMDLTNPIADGEIPTTTTATSTRGGTSFQDGKLGSSAKKRSNSEDNC